MQKGLTFIVSALLLFSFTSCIRFNKAELKNSTGDVKIIGHAGSGFASWYPFNPFPSNSYASIQKALKNGAHGIEVDVHMTVDNQFILYHDDQLHTKTAAEGCPSQHTLADLEKIPYKLGAPFDWFHSETLFSLDRMVDLLIANGGDYDLHLDLRNHSACHDADWDLAWEKEMVKQLHLKLQSLNISADRVYIITYSQRMLSEAMRLELPYHLSFEIVGNLDNGIAWAKKNAINKLTIKPKLMSPELGSVLSNQGFEVITFGAKSKWGNKKLLEYHPHIIQTNNIPALTDLLKD